MTPADLAENESERRADVVRHARSWREEWCFECTADVAPVVHLGARMCRACARDAGWAEPLRRGWEE